jgi:hypothetical protein
VLPAGTHWNPKSERWGSEDGDTIEVSPEEPAEIFVRFDLREWRPELYERFIAFVQGIDGRLFDAELKTDVALTGDALMASLRGSRAARFVKDPYGYFAELRANPIRESE